MMKLQNVIVLIFPLFLSTGCGPNVIDDAATAKIPLYEIPADSINSLAKLTANAVSIDSIDGARIPGNIIGNQTVGVVAGKRRIRCRFSSFAGGKSTTVEAVEFDLDFVAGQIYKLAAKTTKYTVFTIESELVFINETEGSLKYLTGPNSGKVVPWSK